MNIKLETLLKLNQRTVNDLILALQALPADVRALKWGGIAAVVPSAISLINVVDPKRVLYDTALSFFDDADYAESSLSLMVDVDLGAVAIYSQDATDLTKTLVEGLKPHLLAGSNAGADLALRSRLLSAQLKAEGDDDTEDEGVSLTCAATRLRDSVAAALGHQDDPAYLAVVGTCYKANRNCLHFLPEAILEAFDVAVEDSSDISRLADAVLLTAPFFELAVPAPTAKKAHPRKL